jgi:hypothetical protein
MTRIVLIMLAVGMLSGCGAGARFVGFGNCSADGSVVWFEYPNSKGEYEGLNNAPCKKPA